MTGQFPNLLDEWDCSMGEEADLESYASHQLDHAIFQLYLI